jgi:hypothetical protein
MTFADVPLGEEFKEDGVTYTKLSDTQARGPKWRWRESSLYEFEPDDEVEYFWRWRIA